MSDQSVSVEKEVPMSKSKKWHNIHEHGRHQPTFEQTGRKDRLLDPFRSFPEKKEGACYEGKNKCRYDGWAAPGIPCSATLERKHYEHRRREKEDCAGEVDPAQVRGSNLAAQQSKKRLLWVFVVFIRTWEEPC